MRKLIAGLVAIGMATAACGGDDDDADTMGGVSGTTAAESDTTTGDTGPATETTGPPGTAGTTNGTGSAPDLVPATGIDGKTVKIAIVAKLEACGTDEAQANANVYTDATKGVLDEYVAFTNEVAERRPATA